MSSSLALVNNLLEDLTLKEETKTQDTNNNEEYTLYYWTLRNRGNFIRLQFVYTDTKFKELNDQKYFKAWDKENDDSESLKNNPVFASPALMHGDL